MGALLEQVTSSPEVSLTLIVDDLMRRHRDCSAEALPDPDALQDWLNVLGKQSMPLISTPAGRANLEAWLDAVG
ncbi:MAG: hypothetical protein SFV19_07000 [Rhodospirillaceae bacterium]|nr:hypothetical protein [Rhodospirillaceae bacterium]